MKGLYLRFIIILIFIAGFISFSSAQRSNGLAVEGKVSVEEGSVEGAVIQMYQDGQRLDDYGIGRDGQYKVELNYNHKFELIFYLRNNFSQKIVVETDVPSRVLQSDPSFPPFPVNINLFTEIDGIDDSFSKNTVLKIYYSEQVDNFISDLYYNDAQIKNLIDQAILQSQMIDKEVNYLSRLTRAELAELRKEYDQLLKEADEEYGNERFLDALDGYKAANQVFPDEQYPKDRVAEINDLLGIIMVAEDMDKALAERFETLITNADNFFNAQQYFEARNAYNRALSIRPTDNHANQRVKEINEILKAQQTEQQYQDLIVRGNNAFNEMLYQEALPIFNEATALRPNEEYPKTKIREINEKLADLAKNLENQKSYDQAIFQAELNFEKQFYDKSLASYENALTFRPGDAKATDRINEINEIMGQLSNRTLYEKLINSADKAYKKEQLQEALTDYEKALALFPEEEYPVQRIDIINQKLQAEADFLAAIQEADEAFNEKQYQSSKSFYNQALEIRSGDRHSQDRIKEIDKILGGLQVDEQYNSVIAEADRLLNEQNYENAKNKYTEALSIKSREQYPKDKIAEINSVLRELTALNQRYQQTIDRADNLFERENYENAKTVYAEAGNIKPTESYPPEMIGRINGLLDEQERILAEQQAAEQARLEAQANERDENYQKIIDEADVLVGENQFVAAIGKFRSALDIKPNEQYPISRIEEIRGMIARQQEVQKAYEEAVARGDREFRREGFDAAKLAFNDAKAAKADEIYPDEMIAQIDSIVDARAQLAADAEAAEAARLAAIEAETDRQYNEAITKADGFFNGQEYENARTEYRTALNVKPEETYPQTRIDEIGTLLSQLSEAQKAYEEAVARGDREFRREGFDAAKLAFNEAKAAKADETYPDEMIAQIDSIVDARAQLAAEAAAAEAARLAAIEAETDRQYNEAITKADGFFNGEEYENARTEYRTALNVKPEETYPQTRIDEINSILEQLATAQRELESLNRNYENAIQIADNFFTAKSYLPAKTNYEKASLLKPEEQYPVQKITEIDDILQQQKMDEEYRTNIVAADGYFRTESYASARDEYEKALNVKPEEQYPKNQIEKIDDIFQKEQERILAEQQAAADLERRRNEIQQISEENMEREIVSEAGLTGLYNEYIQTADAYFESKNYNVSRGWYYKAWDVKPEETYPPQRIDEINRLVGGLLSSQRDRDYQEFIDLADSTFRDNQLAVARGWYNRALSIKSDENYPKNQIEEIQRLITERLAGQSGELFNENIQKASAAFDAENYTVARFWYKKALEIDPDNENALNRINEIQELLE